MGIQLDIPDSIVEAMHIPQQNRKEQLMIELALALYARGILSFGKARELAGLDKYPFGLLLGQRGIPRHYGTVDLEDDFAYADGKDQDSIS